MASAKIQTVEVEVTVTAEEERVVLELTHAEAQFIRDLTHRIGGDPVKSRRKYADALGEALVGVTGYPDTSDFDDERAGRRSAIYFVSEEGN